jgi:hypothetical protein
MTFLDNPDLFPDIEMSNYKAVLEQYPVEWFLRAGDPPPPLGLEVIEGSDILKNPTDPQFEEYVQFLEIALPLDSVSIFGTTIAPYVTHGQPNQSLVRFLLSAVASFCRRGPLFRKQFFQSDFFDTPSHHQRRPSGYPP